MHTLTSTKCFAIKQSLRKSGFKEPLEMLGIMMLFILGVVMFPTRRIVQFFYHGDKEWVFWLADGIQRLLFSVMMLRFVFNFGFRIWAKKVRFTGLLVVVPALIIATNNFPFVSYFMGECELACSKEELISFTVWCLGVGIFEELSFRGIILPLVHILIHESPRWRVKIKQADGAVSVKIKKRTKKHAVFFTVAFSSAIFALTHLVNIFNGNIGGTIVQIGYTFLIGAMCGIVTVKTGNVALAALVHFVYNFCGMLIEYCGKGVMWTWQQIVCTASVGVVIGVIMIIIVYLADRSPELTFGMLGDGAEEALAAVPRKKRKTPKTRKNA